MHASTVGVDGMSAEIVEVAGSEEPDCSPVVDSDVAVVDVLVEELLPGMGP